MVPRSRLVVLGTIASLVLAAGCNNQITTTTTIEDTTRVTRATKAPSRGGAFRGTVNFGGTLTADKATVSLVDEKLQLITFAGKAKPDSAGKFALKPAPTRVYFVLVEGEKSKMLGAVLPVESKDPKDEPEITVNAASTLAVAGILGAFDTARGGQYQLEDLPVALFEKLVVAIAVTNPQLDFTRDPRDHGAQFTQLYEKDAAVKAAYDALFADLKGSFEKRNPGLPVPSPSLPSATLTPDPNGTATTGPGGFASIAPSPTPSPLPSPSPTPSATPSTGASATASPTVSLPPRTFDPLKHTMAEVTGNSVDGTPLTLDESLHYPTKVAINDPGVVEIMVIPDNNRLLMADSLTEQFKFFDLRELLKAQPTDPAVAVSNVFGAATDGTTVYAVGTVGGSRHLITATVNFTLVPPSYTVTATSKALVGGDLPSSAAGQAFHDGSLYLACSPLHRIYKVDVATGATARYSGDVEASTVLTGATAVATARYKRPSGLLTIGDFMYVSEEDSHRILRVNLLDDTVAPFAGRNTTSALVSGTLTDARFQRPTALYADNQGRFLVADRTNGAVRRLDPDADPTKAEVLHYVVVDDAGANPVSKFVPNFFGVGRVGPFTYAIDQNGKLQKLTEKL